MSSLTNWDFFNRNVQGGLLEGRFLNAAFTLVAAGPPRLATAPGSSSDFNEDIAYPIGVLQSVGVGQSSQIMQVWEIGSQRSYFIRGRTAGQVALGRIMYHGPSLLRVLYAYASGKKKGGGSLFDSLYENTAQANTNLGNTTRDGVVRVEPGYENLWINLASDIFDQPIGLLIIMKDSNDETYGAFYIEYAMVANHNWQTDAGGTILAENCSLQYDQILPVDVKAVELIASSAEADEIVGTVIGSAE